MSLNISGLLDETFFMYGEDIDLSFRIRKAGYENYYFPELILHYKGESTKKDIRYVRNFYEAMLIFFNKHYPNSNGIFKCMIRGAIVVYGFFTAVQNSMKRTREGKRKTKKKEFTFNIAEVSYENMLHKMNENPDKRVLYRIYHPQRGITFAANEIQFE